MKRVARRRLAACAATVSFFCAALGEYAPAQGGASGLVLVSEARADGRPEMQIQIDADVVEVGGTVRLSFSVTSSDAMPSNPQPGATPGFRVRQTSVSPSQSISIVNGVRSDRQGLNVTWALEAITVGTHAVGPIQVDIGARHWQTQKTTIKVVPRGQGPRPDPRRGGGGGLFGPGFDPWKGLFGQLDDELNDQPRQPQLPPADPKLALDAPRGEVAFLHATIDKKAVVVGEQVTLLVYLYIEEDVRDPDFQDAHEVTAGDFLKRPLMEDDRTARLVGIAELGGRRYSVRIIRKSALFPLKAGDLEIGPMTLAIAKGRGAGVRETESLRVRVTEPPIAGRPPGYAIGDVGKMALAADVSPRKIERGGAVGVTIELSGTGNLPSALAPPVRAGLEWLEPTVTEKIGLVPVDRFGGKRTFSFVVRVKQPGKIDLGAFTLPYWDPEAKAYAVARAELGTVDVTGAPAPEQAADAPIDPLPGLPLVRTTRSGTPLSRVHLADTPLFWGGLALPTLAYAVAFGARAAARRQRERARARATSPAAEMKARIGVADAACQGRDPRAAFAAIARAIEAATLAQAGVNVRGIAVHETSRALEARGVAPTEARALQALLEACGSARFSPEGDDIEAARTRWAEAQRVLRGLKRT